jgi:PLD-like domain
MDVRLVDHGWGKELAALCAAHHGSLRIICPFIKQETLWELVGDEIPQDTRIVTRFSLRDFSSGVTDIAALRDVVEADGAVRGIKGLHSKAFIFGDSAAVVTSANLTHAALHRNQEFGCISELPDFIAACQSYFEELWGQGAPASVSELDVWEKTVGSFLLAGRLSGSS